MKTKEKAKTTKQVFKTGKRVVSKTLAIKKSVKSGFQVKEFCQRYRVVRPDLIRLTGYSLRSVDNWAAGDEPSAAAKKQLKELVRLFASLSDLMESSKIGPWLKEPNAAFSDSTPLQVIERGETDRIWRMIHLLETGEPG